MPGATICHIPISEKMPIIHTCRIVMQSACGIQLHHGRLIGYLRKGIAMNESKHTSPPGSNDEISSLLLGAGFALASLIILPALAQRIGLGSSLTIALRGALMRAANRV